MKWSRWYVFAIRKFLTKPAVWILAILAIGLSFWSGNRGEMPDADRLVVGVLFESDTESNEASADDAATAAWKERLLSHDGIVRFVIVDSEDALEQRTAREAVLGYVVPKDWQRAFLQMDTGIVHRIGKADGILREVVDETFFSYALEQYVPLVLDETLQDIGARLQRTPPSDAVVRAAVEANRQDTFRFAIDAHLASGTWQGTSRLFPVRGILILLWTLWVFLAALDAKQMQCAGQLDRLAKRQKWKAQIPLLIVAAIAGWLVTSIAVAVAGQWAGWERELIHGAFFAMALFALSALIVLAVRSLEGVALVVAMLFLIVLVSAPIWFDLGNMAPTLRLILDKLPWYAYLSAF